MTINISKFKVAASDLLPCYDEVQGQETRAYIYVDISNKEMWVGCKQPSDNTLSFREARGYLRSFRIPNNLTSRGYNDLLDHPSIRELAELMVAEASEYYDGSNYRIRLSQVGMDAEVTLMNLCNAIEHGDYESLEPAGAHYYIAEGSYEALMSAGGTHEEVAERIVAEAIKDGYYLIAYDVEKHLDAMKDAAAHGNNI
jgi:hypothetical protein